ncbi:MAG TPA: amino acid adenylation domain-containing protein, partial [Candidatus Deferrimicrobium sp.]|nr:amino acid adenylation domain-containing protein [Candidatus Deferrimicrobium sp.]
MLNKKTLDQLSVAASQRVKEKEYWLRKLSGFQQKSRFPLDYTRKSAVEYRLENVSFELSPQLSAVLIKLSAGSDVRLHILLAAGLSALLHRYLGAGGFETDIDHENGGPSDIVIGCPILKSGNETDFINTLLALRIQVRSHMTFKELLLDVQQTVVEALENCNYPVEILAEQLNKPFSAGDEFPLFDIAMLMENIHDKKLLEDLRLDMIFSFKRENSSLRGCVEYNPSLYDRATIERIKFHFQYLLENAAANPGESISALEFMTVEEKEQLLITFNDTKTGYPAGKSIPGLFAEQAEKNPDHIALIGVAPYARCVHLTYRELDEKSGRLACLLVEKGVLAGDIVGIKIKRSPEMIIGILGILKAGGAYMPIDPEYPPERIEYMLKDSGTRILINKSEIRNSKYEGFETFETRLVLNFENLNFDIVSNFEFHASNLVSSNLAYIMYTSGSTGQPKGVMVCHRNVVRLVKNTNFVQLHPETRILQTGAPVFDATTLEIWGSLLNGGQLVLTDKETILDVRRLDKVLKENRINTLWLSSPLFNQLMQQSIELFSTLQYLLVGGDVLAPVNIKRVKQRFPGLNIINGYGPTENTTFSTTYLIEKEFETNIPIGQPIANSTAYIYDQNNRLVPLGAVGELVVGGDGVALGYLNNPELTADKFYRSYRSYKTGIVYKTGDLARWLPDGNIEFLGRIDQQVKIRGFRVELGEIENRLSSHPKVKETLVITREGKAGEEKSLYAYVVPAAPYTVDSLDLAELREYMTGLLPGYMVPAFLTALEKIPLNPNGKIDRQALPEPLRTGSNYIAPRDEIEEKLAQIWAEVLNLGKNAIGIDDDFFELGGHSLKATTLVYRIYKELQVNLEIEKVFTHPTIRELGRQLKGLEELEYDEIETVENEEYYDLSYAQRRLWVLCQFEEDSTAYNIPGAVIVSGPLKTVTLARAFQALVDRHESLRTVFISVNGNPRQKILGRLECNLEQIDLRSHGNKAKEEKAREIYREHSNQAFDLEKGPLSSFKLVRLDEEQYLVIFNIHHIVSDGWSQGVIYNEVTRLYNAFLKNEENPLPPLQLQYKDYTIWHKQLIETNRFTGSRHFWLEKFKDKPNGIELPLDHSRKPIQTFNGGRVSLTLDNEKTAKLHRLSLEEGATLFMSLLALVNIFLYRYTGQKDIIIGSPIANRKRPELHHMVGFLVNTLIYRNQVDPGKTFRQLLAETKQEALACYRFQDYPFDLLVEQLGLDRDLSQSPLFNVMLAHNNAETEDTALKMEGVTISPYSHSDDFNMSKFDLTFFMDEIAGQVITRIEYNSDLFERSSIERMAANFLCLAEHVLMDVDTPVSRLKYLAQEEYEKVVQRFNDTGYPFSHLTLSELFESRVEKCRDKTAVVHDHHGKIEKISYDDLNKRANQLAHYLANKYRVKPNHIIAVSLERSIDMIVVLWGIIKAGAAYLAVDPTYPRDRVLHVLGDSRSDLLIIDEMRPQLFDNYKGEILNINDMREEIRAGAVENPGIINAPSDILYVNYTSGSTGTPNGAMLSHDCLTNLIRWQSEMTAIDCSLRCLQFTSINFCVSFQEIMGTLTSGGELYLIGEVERQDIDYLINFLVKHQIEILFLPFSYLNFLFNESGRWNQSFNHSLKHIITAGEQLKITAGLKRFLDLNPGLRLHNHYGSTEMHVVTSYTLEAATAGRMPVPPAGKPIGNVKIYILDEYYNPVPIGVYGELYVSGSSEVLGYINNEELNSKKLYYHPELSKANGNKRLYRSGDIGRWMADGNIELRGRKDFQVKIRGFRIEPGEIESKILGIENIRECVVVVKEDASRQKYLVAYISVDNVEISEIKKRIGRDLPQYMIPQLVVLDSLPLMHNGKVDREKLPEPQLKAEGTYTAPRDALEKTLANIWAEILNLPQHIVGIDANFFELGGHSLKAVSMINKINKILGVVVPLQEVFHGPTIADISQVIKNSKIIGFRNIEKQTEKEYYELSHSQKRLWYISKTEPDNPVFNMPGVTTLHDCVDEAVVRRVLEQLTARHESLRTFFTEKDKEPVQAIEHPDRLKLNLEVIDLT